MDTSYKQQLFKNTLRNTSFDSFQSIGVLVIATVINKGPINIVMIKKLGDYFYINEAATVLEAYDLVPLIEDIPINDSHEYFKFINTGTN